MSEKIEIKEVKEYPICPHCSRELSTIHWHKVRGSAMSGVGYVSVYSCPHCRKVLSTAANRG